MRYDDFYFSLVLDFVKTHPGSIFSVYLANKEMKSSYEKGKLLFEALTPEMRISAMGKSLQEELEILKNTATGQLFPGFVGISEQGDTVRIDTLAGQVTVVDFWASWCGPCRKEMQSLKQLYHDYQERGLKIISISLDESVSVDAYHYALTGYYEPTNYYSPGYEGIERHVKTKKSSAYNEWFYEGFTPHQWKDGPLANVLYIGTFGGTYPYVKEYR